jgi:hypothetical protein
VDVFVIVPVRPRPMLIRRSMLSQTPAG